MNNVNLFVAGSNVKLVRPEFPAKLSSAERCVLQVKIDEVTQTSQKGRLGFAATPPTWKRHRIEQHYCTGSDQAPADPLGGLHHTLGLDCHDWLRPKPGIANGNRFRLSARKSSAVDK